jgi:RND family efflux transporter MFP subunit
MNSIRNSYAAQPWRIFSLVLLAAMLAAGCGSRTKANSDDAANAPHVAVVKVTRTSLSSTLEIASEFQPFQEVNVYAKVSGYIKKLDIDWGTHVHQGQVMATLEVPELQQQVEVDEAAVRRGQEDVTRAQENVNGAESTYNVAHLTYTRLANVQKTQPELVAQEEVDEAQGKDSETSAGVSAARASLSAAREALAEAKASLEKDKALYSYTQITAPYDGVVTEMDAYTGALLPAGTSSNKGDEPLCHLSQNDQLRLVIPVPERAVPSIAIGENVAVHVTTIDKTFQGKIARIADQIDMTTRTMHTEITVRNPKYTLIPGMYATVELPLQTAQATLTLPVQAVQVSGETRGAVLVVGANNRIESRAVAVGIQSASKVQIVSGLNENDRVIFGEQSQYKPGELVNPQLITPPEAD